MSLIHNKVRCLHCNTCAHRMSDAEKRYWQGEEQGIYSSFCACQRVAFIGDPALAAPALMVKPGTQYEYTS